jgi:hypothetical protein
MAAVETIALVKGSDTVVVNAGSAQEADLRAQGYRGEGEKPAPKAAPKAKPKAKASNE